MDNNNNFGISESELMNAALGDFDDAPAKPESKDIFSSSTPAASPAGAFANNAPNAGVNPPANGQDVTKPVNPAPAGYRPAPPANGQNFGAPVNPVQANRSAQGQAAPVAKPVQNAANPVNPAPAGYRPAPPVGGQNFGAPVNPVQANRSANIPVTPAVNPAPPAPVNRSAPAQDYNAPAGQPVNNIYVNNAINTGMPMRQLKTDRSLIKYVLLSMITFAIYGIYCLAGVADDLNITASRYDGKKTMNAWLLAFVISPITFGIAIFVWYHKISARLGDELDRRGIDYSFDASTYWLWCILGAFIIVGPFIYFHKFFTASNLINEDYNRKGF